MTKATRIIVALAALALARIGTAQAQSVEDYYAELKEWVYGPCMEVASTLTIGSLDKDSREQGVKREHVAQFMLTSRDQGCCTAPKLDPQDHAISIS